MRRCELFPVILTKHPKRAFAYRTEWNAVTRHLTELLGTDGVAIIRWMRKYRAACVGDALLWFITQRHAFEFIDVFLPFSHFVAGLAELETIIGHMDEVMHNQRDDLRLLMGSLRHSTHRLRLMGHHGQLAKIVRQMDINLCQISWHPSKPNEMFVRYLEDIRSKTAIIVNRDADISHDRLTRYKADGF